MKQILNLKSQTELLDYFKDERICYEYLEKEWWGDNQKVCPHCGSVKTPYNVKSRSAFKNIPAYRCSEVGCDLPFTIKTDSIFEGTKVELRKWFHAIYEINIDKKGISSLQLAERINVSQKTAWLLLHKLRDAMKDLNEEPLEGWIQSDETFVGGKNKNRHHDKKVKQSQGRSFKDKTPVLGMIQEGHFDIVMRSNKVNPKKFVIEKVYLKPERIKLDVVQTPTSNILDKHLSKNVKFGSCLMTDEWGGYNNAKSDYMHFVCDHAKGQYVSDGFITTNKVENFWSIFDRGITGVYHSVSRKHLIRYCYEFETRFNMRLEKVINKFTTLLANARKPRITYKSLTCGL